MKIKNNLVFYLYDLQMLIANDQLNAYTRFIFSCYHNNNIYL